MYAEQANKSFKHISQLSKVGGLTVRDSRILFAVPEAELQLEARPAIFEDIDCRQSLICREVELPLVVLICIGIPDGKTYLLLQGLVASRNTESLLFGDSSIDNISMNFHMA